MAWPADHETSPTYPQNDSAITVKTPPLSSIAECDRGVHSTYQLFCKHNRRPIEEINGSRSVSELISVLGFGDLGEENNGSVTGLTELGFRDIYPDLLTWESPAVVSTDYVIALSDFGSKFQALRVLICGSAQATVMLEKKYKAVGYL